MSGPLETPVVFCHRQEKWLPVEAHFSCDFCAAPILDAEDDPVSFLCTHDGERRIVQPEWEDPAEEGYGPPARPPGED